MNIKTLPLSKLKPAPYIENNRIFDIPSGSGNKKLKKALRDWSSTHERRVFTFMEIWKDIEGFENRYQVSNLGRIRSVTRNIIRSDNSKVFLLGKVLKKGINQKGYEYLSFKIEYKSHCLKIHRIVALAFIENPLNKKEVNHKDGNKLNNNVNNLEWVTASENQKHAYRTGLKCNKGVLHSNAKLSELEVLDIRNCKGKIKAKDMAKKYKLNIHTIYSIWAKRSWSHI